MNILSPGDIGKVLKTFRKKKGFTKDQVAELVPISRIGYHYWETAERQVNIFALSRLSCILGFKIILEEGTITVEEINDDERLEDALLNLDVNNLKKYLEEDLEEDLSEHVSLEQCVLFALSNADMDKIKEILVKEGFTVFNKEIDKLKKGLISFIKKNHGFKNEDELLKEAVIRYFKVSDSRYKRYNKEVLLPNYIGDIAIDKLEEINRRLILIGDEATKEHIERYL